jgi:hypothetical protein
MGTWAGGMAGLLASNLVLSQTTARADHVDHYFGL